jgi:predicted aspartyl protease
MTTETPFELERRKLIINGTIYHNDHKENLRLIVDTGAGTSVISRNVAHFLGFDLSKILQSEQFISASGRFTSKIIEVNQFEVLGLSCKNLRLAVIDLPPQSLVSGLIGIDLMMKFNAIAIDFDKKIIETQLLP